MRGTGRHISVTLGGNVSVTLKSNVSVTLGSNVCDINSTGNFILPMANKTPKTNDVMMTKKLSILDVNFWLTKFIKAY